jgi:hypothetical protein
MKRTADQLENQVDFALEWPCEQAQHLPPVARAVKGITAALAPI